MVFFASISFCHFVSDLFWWRERAREREREVVGWGCCGVRPNTKLIKKLKTIRKTPS